MTKRESNGCLETVITGSALLTSALITWGLCTWFGVEDTATFSVLLLVGTVALATPSVLIVALVFMAFVTFVLGPVIYLYDWATKPGWENV